METILLNKGIVIDRLKKQQEKLNNIVSLDECIQLFFNQPSISSWKTLSEQLEVIFKDTSLFGPEVLTAFKEWQNKISAICNDEFSFAMDFNLEYRFDFGKFLLINLKCKNFNY